MPGCVRAMALAQRMASGLDPAERIWLEEHLAECRSCAAETSLLESLADALRKPDWALKPRAREALLERALRVPKDRPRVEKRAPRRAVLAFGAAVAAAAAAAMVLFARPDPARLESIGTVFRTVAAPAAAPRTQPAPAVRIDDRGCDPASAGEMATGTRTELGRAKVEVLRASRLCWRPERATVELVTGALRIEVEKGSESGFRVVTERFVVHVVGTVFEVDLERVSVSRGKVKILALGAGEQLALLGPGQNWSPQPAKTSAIPAPAVAARLGQARRHLAAGRVAAARAELRQLSRGSLEPFERAELQSLLAECSLVEGKLDEAARAYGEVANRHTGTLTGETALFAQARAELRAGRRDAARARLEKYLAQYPNGRFRREALGHLRSIEEKP